VRFAPDSDVVDPSVFAHNSATIGFTFESKNRRAIEDLPKMKTTQKKEALKDASHLYEVERRAYHLKRPGFRISELQLSPTQTVPWHSHNHISDMKEVLP
jgi:hypothetical protein